MVKRILYFLGILALYACTDSVDAEKAANYFPLEDGLFWEYQVVNVQYSLTEAPKNNSYFLKEKLSEISENEYKIEQYTKQNSSDSWTLSATAVYSQNANKIIRTDAGVSKVILFANPTEGLSWNQNELNTLEEKTVNVAAIKENFNSFSNTVQVVERKDSSLISKDYIYAVYANDIGLIYQENTDIEFCQSNADCIGSGQIDSGISYKATLIESGKE
ncbi:hypothetical protein [Arcticibacterium luteifluviistationis]|uniref:Uncharacterized protein n=1 Tax=Arcticibacterium luteifluviistationis TaxID=1784714 RepID=A0A2Z4GD93_9BACT|nr:hypothetical protein [Arcticibacterium luteifluviistationis]AWV99206.1 hypothetical protein DJ013_13940 [Arcticibacterium luteifluviistationis]